MVKVGTSSLRIVPTRRDFVMIARAAMNDPLIFRNILHYFKTGKVKETTPEEKIKLCFEYFSLDPAAPVHRWKAVSQHFTRGIVGSPALRDKITKAGSKAVVEELLQKFKV